MRDEMYWSDNGNFWLVGSKFGDVTSDDEQIANNSVLLHHEYNNCAYHAFTHENKDNLKLSERQNAWKKLTAEGKAAYEENLKSLKPTFAKFDCCIELQNFTCQTVL